MKKIQEMSCANLRYELGMGRAARWSPTYSPSHDGATTAYQVHTFLSQQAAQTATFKPNLPNDGQRCYCPFSS